MAHSDATIDVQYRKKTDSREIRATIKYKMDDPNRQINTSKSVKKNFLEWNFQSEEMQKHPPPHQFTRII